MKFRYGRCSICLILMATYISFIAIYFVDKGSIKDDNLDFKQISLHIYASTGLIIANLLICVGLIAECVAKLIIFGVKDYCLSVTKFILLILCFIPSFMITLTHIIILNCFILDSDSKIAPLCLYDPHIIYKGWCTTLILITLMVYVVSLPYISFNGKRLK